MENILKEFKDFISKMSAGGIKKNIRREMTKEIKEKWELLSNKERIFISKSIPWSDYNKYRNYIRFLNLEEVCLKYPIKVAGVYYGIGTSLLSTYIADNNTFEEKILLYPCNNEWQGIEVEEKFEIWIEEIRDIILDLNKKSKDISNLYSAFTFACPNRCMDNPTWSMAFCIEEGTGNDSISIYKDMIKILSEIIV